ncbi:hypothetical protein V2J09_013854 [Rumex salicifolius]
MPSVSGICAKTRVDESDSLTLDAIRHSLIRQEDSIIFGLWSQYSYNPNTYDPNAFSMAGFNGSLAKYMLMETEKLHAQVGRYNSPDEHPFFPNNLPDTLLPPLQYPKVLHPISDSININKKVWDMYFNGLLPRLVKEGDDGNAGSVAVCDTMCLQALSKRIHYGKFVAEAKFRASPDIYKKVFNALVGLFFPAVTGIMAGSNLSASLKDTQRSIPVGTLAATLTTSGLYLVSVLIFGAFATREKLLTDRLITETVAWPFPAIIYVGIILSTLGAALQSLTSAPRLLAAIANDDILPVLNYFKMPLAGGLDGNSTTGVSHCLEHFYVSDL